MSQRPDWIDPAIIGAISAAAIALIAKGGPVLLKLLNVQTQRQKFRTSLQKDGYEEALCSLNDQVRVLRDEIVEVRKEAATEKDKHVQCLIEQERLRAHQKYLDERSERQQAEIMELRRRLELLRPSDPILRKPVP